MRVPRRCCGAFTLQLLVNLWLIAPGVSAQATGTATIRGTIADQSGAILPGATVALINEGTRDTRDTTSDERGSFAFGSVFAGTYAMRVTLPGFKVSEQAHVRVSASDTLRVDVTLEVGERSETVVVTARANALRTDTGAREYTLTSREFSNLPVVSRSALELLRILPGVVAPEPETFETVSFGGGANNTSAYTVNGVRGRSNTVTLDGTNLIDIGSNSGVMVSPNPGMLEEIKVQTSNYGAEYGSSGMQVSAVTRAGTSNFRGTLYDHARYWRWSANDRSNSQLGLEKPHSRFQYPGGTLGGPLIVPGTAFNKARDRWFFFVGAEVQRQLPDNGSTQAVVPTEQQRRGDFSENLLGIFGQPTTVLIPSGFPDAGTPAPNNDLSPYVHPVGSALAGTYPLPN